MVEVGHKFEVTEKATDVSDVGGYKFYIDENKYLKLLGINLTNLSSIDLARYFSLAPFLGKELKEDYGDEYSFEDKRVYYVFKIIHAKSVEEFTKAVLGNSKLNSKNFFFKELRDAMEFQSIFINMGKNSLMKQTL